LTSHFVSWVRCITGQAKVGNLELAIRCDEQIVRLQILSCGTVVNRVLKRDKIEAEKVTYVTKASYIQEREGRTRWRIKFRWQNSRPRNVMAIQLLMSAGRKRSEGSLMIISRSVSRNSRTRFRFVLEENTSRSLRE
jgi:hypothetical protein